MSVELTDITAAIRCINKTESERRDLEIFLESVDFKTVDLGSAYERRTLLAPLALTLEYIEAPALVPLFTQGDAGEYMYIVLSGEVGHYISSNVRIGAMASVAQAATGFRRRSGDGGRERRHSSSDVMPSGRIRSSRRKSSSEDITRSAEEAARLLSVPRATSMAALPKMFGPIVAVSPPAAVFGELALISEGRRSATAVAHVHSTLARVHKSTFQALLKGRAEAALRDKVEALSMLPSFAAFEPRELQRLSYAFRQQRVGSQSRILVQGERADHVYILLSGEARVLWSHPAQPPGGPPFEVATVLRGELIGAVLEPDAGEEGEPSEFTVQVSRAADLLAIPRSDFLQAVSRFPEVLDSLQQLIRGKFDAWRERARAKFATEPQGRVGGEPGGGGGLSVERRSRYSLARRDDAAQRPRAGLERPRSHATLALAPPGLRAAAAPKDQGLPRASSDDVATLQSNVSYLPGRLMLEAPPLDQPAAEPHRVASVLSWHDQERCQLALRPVGFA